MSIESLKEDLKEKTKELFEAFEVVEELQTDIVLLEEEINELEVDKDEQGY